MPDYADQTKCNYIVAKQQKNKLWVMYFSADDFETALRQYDNIQADQTGRYLAAGIFTRSQWYGDRAHTQRRKSL